MSPIERSLVNDLRLGIDALVRAFKIAETSRGAEDVPKLNPSDIQALLFISSHPNCIASDVGSFLGVVPTTTSAIVDRLVRQELVSRTRTEENRRIVLLQLSSDGVRVVEAIVAEQTRHCIAMLEKLDPDERRPFVRAIQKIAAQVG